MSQTTYKITETIPQGLEKYSNKDIKIVESFEINSTFNSKLNKIEYHIYSLDGELLESDYTYSNQAFLQGSGTAGTQGASEITVDPIKDIKQYGYPYGGVSVVYNFLDDLYSPDRTPVQFYINEISEDRKEIRLLTNQIDNSRITEATSNIKSKLDSTSYFSDFRVNVGNNDLLIGVNIGTQQYKEYVSVIVKLYEPLPDVYGVKDLLSIEQVVNNSLGYEIEAEIIQDDLTIPQLKSPNFSIDLESGNTVVPSEYFNFNELYSYPTENTYRELNSLFAEKGINISIDYTDYSEYIHFSSANERLRNFKYKLDLIENYQTNLDLIESSGTTVSGSREYYKDNINTILNNFDHYDRHLYFESGSTSWPKVNTTRPYLNATGSLTSSWYNQELANTLAYDLSNTDQLLNTVPAYLREDTQNDPYELFIHMVGQHFDNLWIYTKAVTDKYDNDNRVNKGISKDLVEDALRNFGVKLYTSNNSLQNLFKNFTGEFYQTGSEQITLFTTASNEVTSEENYKKEIYKRLYHNLPLLLKSKGTERGLRALINSFGIPTSYSSGSYNGLTIKTLGGSFTSGSYNLGPEQINTSSLAKIRIDNTGSVVEGSTLSQYSSIVKRGQDYTDDLHSIEVGYSLTDTVNQSITPALSASSFNIDDYIGDPRLQYSSSYTELLASANSYMTTAMVSGSHNLQDFTRILKFYDNVIFKMVKDFVPARSNTSTGIIVKPHLLERNKIKQVAATYEDLTITGSLEVGTYSGSHGSSFGAKDEYTTSYTESVVTPDGINYINRHLHEETKYDGEFSGSLIRPVFSPGELNDENTFKYDNPNTVLYKIELTYDCGFVVDFIGAPPAFAGKAPNLCAFELTATLGHKSTPAPTAAPTVAPVTPTPAPVVACGFSLNAVSN